MAKYRVGDVVRADYSYYNNFSQYVTQSRRWVITKIEDADIYFTSYITKRLYQSNKHDGIIVLQKSQEGIAMALTEDSFIYCDEKVEFSEDEIDRRIGNCPIINDILTKLKSNCPSDFS